MSLGYICKDGIVISESIEENYFDTDNPLEESYFFMLKKSNPKENALIPSLFKTTSERVYSFGIYEDKDGKLSLISRKKANFGYLYVDERNLSSYFRGEINSKLLFKRAKKDAKRLLHDYNCYKNDEVFVSTLYSFDGEYIDSYMDLYGKDIYENHTVLMLGKPISSIYYFRPGAWFNQDELVNEETVKAYINTNFEITDLGQVINVDFGDGEDIFSKDDILQEFYDSCKTNTFLKRHFNEMLISISKNVLEKLT